MSSDQVSDLLTQIRNGYMAKKDMVKASYSKFNEEVLKILAKEGHLESYKKKDEKLEIFLLYKGKEPALTHVKRVSKPGRRIYTKKKSLPKVLGGLGIAIVSTPKGVMTNKEAKKLGLGGEILCEVW